MVTIVNTQYVVARQLNIAVVMTCWVMPSSISILYNYNKSSRLIDCAASLSIGLNYYWRVYDI